MENIYSPIDTYLPRLSKIFHIKICESDFALSINCNFDACVANLYFEFSRHIASISTFSLDILTTSDIFQSQDILRNYINIRQSKSYLMWTNTYISMPKVVEFKSTYSEISIKSIVLLSEML